MPQVPLGTSLIGLWGEKLAQPSGQMRHSSWKCGGINTPWGKLLPVGTRINVLLHIDLLLDTRSVHFSKLLRQIHPPGSPMVNKSPELAGRLGSLFLVSVSFPGVTLVIIIFCTSVFVSASAVRRNSG